MTNYVQSLTGFGKFAEKERKGKLTTCPHVPAVKKNIPFSSKANELVLKLIRQLGTIQVNAEYGIEVKNVSLSSKSQTECCTELSKIDLNKNVVKQILTYFQMKVNI